MFTFLTSDQKERVRLMKTMCLCTTKEAKEALIDNQWDTSMAVEWYKNRKENPDLTLEEFQTNYKSKLNSAAVLPQDRYDVSNSSGGNSGSNRATRRANKKKKK